jgi:hypothetical protein
VLSLKRFPVIVIHVLEASEGVRIDYLPKHVDLALQLFSLCHFVTLPARAGRSHAAGFPDMQPRLPPGPVRR